MKRCFTMLLSAMIFLSVPLAATAQSPIVMKIGTSTINDSVHEWAKIFADHVGKDTGGRIKVEIYPGNQLGTSPRMIEQTQLGSIQGVVCAADFFVGIEPAFQVLGAPGLFKDLSHANRVLQDPAFNNAYLDLGASKGLQGVGLFISGPLQFLLNRPATKISDFKDLKIRVLAGHLQLAQVRAVGAAPIPMPLGEVLPALQQGAIDGVLGSIPIFYALRYYDVSKYLIDTNHGLIAATAMISKLWLDKLPPDLQKIVIKAGVKASNEVYQFSVDDIERARVGWVKNGGVIVNLEPQEQEKLMKKMVEVGAQSTSGNPRSKALFDLLKQTALQTSK